MEGAGGGEGRGGEGRGGRGWVCVGVWLGLGLGGVLGYWVLRAFKVYGLAVLRFKGFGGV